MNLNAQDYLAKLLAKENLTVQHGNYSTASFAPTERVLRLPLWADKGKAVYDLLVGHEVGHALYTPIDGWHDSDKTIPGVPRSYINIIEDIRIEKKIQRTYPGIVRSFKKGYKTLFDDNLFGTADRDMTKASFMDRLNIHSKGRGYFPVEFTNVEQLFVDLAMGVETWDDVLNACREINDFVKSKEDYEDEEAEEFNENPSNYIDEEGEGEEIEMPTTNPGNESDDQEDTGEESDTLTDDIFRDNEKELLDTDAFGNQNTYSSGISDLRMEKMLVSYDTLKAQRLEVYNMKESYDHPWMFEKFDEFLKETKATVNLMAKDFERKKAAYEYSRSSEAKKGSLNVNKLHQYQYSEDIFMTVQQLATAQSHGIIMLIDQSGSMQSMMTDVVKQTMTIALFCKRVNIPFEAYSYTTGAGFGGLSQRDKDDIDATSNELRGEYIKVVNIFNSSMKKKDLMEAMRHQYTVAFSAGWGNPIQYGNICKLDSFGGTPTVQALMIVEKIINKFPRVQNINVMLLTDGMADSVSPENAYSSDNGVNVATNDTITFKFGNQLVTGASRLDVAANTVKALSKITGAKVTGFFLGDNSKHSFYEGFCSFAQQDYMTTKYSSALKAWKKDGLVTLKNVAGFNDFFIVKTDNKSIDEEFEVKENKNGKATAIKDVKSQFRKFSKKKKSGKLLVGKITDAIAV